MKPKDVADFNYSFATALPEGLDVLTASVGYNLHDCGDELTKHSDLDLLDWLLKYYSSVDARREGYSLQS